MKAGAPYYMRVNCLELSHWSKPHNQHAINKNKKNIVIEAFVVSTISSDDALSSRRIWLRFPSKPSPTSLSRERQPTASQCCSSTVRLFASTSATTSTSSSSSNMDSSSSSSSSQSVVVATLDNVSCTHNGGETYQLKQVSYNLQRGSKVALIGRNGTGKSTLLKILHESYLINQGPQQRLDLYREETNYRYTGKVAIPKSVRVCIVDQEPPMPSDVLVGDAIFGITTLKNIKDVSLMSNYNNHNVMDVVRTYRIASQQYNTAQQRQQESDTEDNATKEEIFLVKATANMDALGRTGWDVLTRAEEIATQLKVQHLMDQPLSQLSGGERKRVALCAALVEEPDLLLLDEPTNFLSLAGVKYLTDLLLSTTSKNKMTTLMVTHDRVFLEEVCDCIVELDHGSLYEHRGSYSSYLQAKEERLALEDAALQNAKSKYKVELEWMRRQPQARESKSKARIDAFYKLEKSTKPGPHDPNLNLSIGDTSSRRFGSKIVSMKNVNLKFGQDRVILEDFNYDFCVGDRICLAGANGVGKTTFTKLITGELEPDSGEIEIGETVVLGVYDQLGLKFDPAAESQTVMEYVVDQVQAHDDSTSMAQNPDEARKLLRQFEFPRSRWNERISVLSGGERRRLQLLSVLSARPNFLILDEPSVDCDMNTLSALESFLEQFKGVLLIVSHDRAFADKVADHLFVFEGNGIIKDFRGTLSEYAACLVELENQKIQQDCTMIGSVPSDINNQANYRQDRAKRNEVRNFVRQAKKEMQNIERTLEKLKIKAREAQTELDNTSSNEGWSVLADLTDKLNALNEEIDQKEMRWLELGEELERLDAEQQ